MLLYVDLASSELTEQGNYHRESSGNSSRTAG
jgi:hypothetical protein